MSSEALDVPILQIVFNRKDTAERVFQEVRKMRPKRLYVAADGPRADHPDDPEKCRAVRQIFDGIDWPCEKHFLFREQNAGCRTAPAAAISWFFEHENAGIILEDDCLPSPQFFAFCRAMLEKYADTPEVMQIAGVNFQNGLRRGDGDYYFSHIAQIWGWASWRRAWRHYDADMRALPDFRKNNILHGLFPGKPFMQWRFAQLFTKVFEHSSWFNTWDYQWTFAIMNKRGLSIVPNANLISNIGSDGTTHSMDDSNLNMPFGTLPENLTHPGKTEADFAADCAIFRRLYKGSWKDKVRFTLHTLTGKDWF